MTWDAAVLIQILVVAFAAHGLQRFFTTDAIGNSFRTALSRWGWIYVGVINERERPGLSGVLGRFSWKLFTCPYCLGAWCCLVLWPLSDHDFWKPLIAILAARGLQTILVKAE